MLHAPMAGWTYTGFSQQKKKQENDFLAELCQLFYCNFTFILKVIQEVNSTIQPKESYYIGTLHIGYLNRNQTLI